MRRCLLVVLATGCATSPDAREAARDTCLPPGVELDTLDPPAQSLLMRRALVCHDHQQGRISDDEYARRVAALDAELRGKRIVRRRQPEFPDRMVVWASSVIDFSTEYSPDAWSASQILGAPDVYPAYGDHNKAWASHGADDRDEWIEVGFEQDEWVSGVEVYETFNPGAIDQIELVTAKGRRIDVSLPATPPPPGVAAKRQFDLRCTQEKIRSVRVHLDSQRVAGWNELDAIGIVPCTR